MEKVGEEKEIKHGERGMKIWMCKFEIPTLSDGHVHYAVRGKKEEGENLLAINLKLGAEPMTMWL